MMSTHGKVTDFQMWDEVLPDEQLLKVKNRDPHLLHSRSQVTGCEEFPEGNLVSWEKTNWFLNSSRGTVFFNITLMVNSNIYQARKETLDLERDVCRSRNLSLHMVPYKLKVIKSCCLPIFSLWFQFDPESLHMCTKLSGEAVQFSKREKFDSIVQHLTAR